MDSEQVKQLAAAGETLTVEFKEAPGQGSRKSKLRTEDWLTAIVGLANGKGGQLLIGVDDNGAITGIGSGYKEFEGLDPARLVGLIRDHTRPEVVADVTFVNIDGKTVIVVEVPAAPQPVGTLQGRYVRRALRADGKPGNVPLLPSEMMGKLRFFLKQDYATLPLPGADPHSDLDAAQFERLRQRAATGVGDVTLKDLADEDILRALRFADVAGSQGQSLTVGAVLMFGTVQAIQRFIPTAEVGFQVLTQAGTSLVQNDIAYVSLLQAMDDFGLRFQMVNRSQEMLVGMRRIDLPEVAEPVFREALANALVHRDYSIGGATLVQVSEKGLRVRSPGGFLPDVSISNLVEETKPRSPALADAFKRAGYVERTGRGVPRMYIDQISNGRPTPDYSQTTAEEVSVFFGFGKADQEMYLFLREWEAQGRSPLDARDLQMMRAIRDLVDPDTEELSERVQLSSDRVRLIAGDLAREGCIAVRGRGRGRNYVLAPLFDDLVGRELPRGAGPAADAEEQRELVLKAAAIRPVTRSDVVKACRVSGPAATYLLKRLVEEGLLERHGQRRGTYYTLAKKAD